MSIEQYQRTVNSLDKDIADLEKKKAALDKKQRRNSGKLRILPLAKMPLQQQSKASRSSEMRAWLQPTGHSPKVQP